MFLASKPAVLLLFLNSCQSWFSPAIRATIEYYYYYYLLSCPLSDSTGRTTLVAARSRSVHCFLFTIAFVNRRNDRSTKRSEHIGNMNERAKLRETSRLRPKRFVYVTIVTSRHRTALIFTGNKLFLELSDLYHVSRHVRSLFIDLPSNPDVIPPKNNI